MGKAGTRTLLGEFPTNRKTCKYIYGIRIYICIFRLGTRMSRIFHTSDIHIFVTIF